MQRGFALAPFPFWAIELFFKEANTYCIFAFFFLSLEYDKDSKLLLWHESQAIAVTNSNTYMHGCINSMGVSEEVTAVCEQYLLPT